MRHRAKKNKEEKFRIKSSFTPTLNARKEEMIFKNFPSFCALITVKAFLFVKFDFVSSKLIIKTKVSVEHCWNGTDKGKWK
jgi:hypothetical protein